MREYNTFWICAVFTRYLILTRTALSFSNGGTHHTEGGIINHGGGSTAGYGYTHYGHSGYVPTGYVPTAPRGIVHHSDGSTGYTYGYTHYGNTIPTYQYGQPVKYCDAYGRCWHGNSKKNLLRGVKTGSRANNKKNINHARNE